MKKIKLFEPVAGEEEKKAINDVLKSGFWASGAGSGKVLEFEQKFNRYVGSDTCIAVNNGTSALHLALSLFDLRGKEVIIPSLSFVSTAHAVIYNGAKPVFVDVDEKTLCLDPELTQKAITKKTKAILPVHFGGMPCNLTGIINICKNSGLELIEDAAHAAGASYGKKRIGTHGKAVCFSFHPVKNLAMPTGGAITLNGNDSDADALLRSRRWCGISNRNGAKYDVPNLGWNFYMNEFSAVIGIEQLKKLDKMNDKRKEIAKRYFKEINLEEKMPLEKNCSYHLYWIQVKNRDSFMEKMTKNGIETGIHYRPIHTMTYYRGKLKLPITESVGNRIVTLPIHPSLSKSDVNKIIELTNKFA